MTTYAIGDIQGCYHAFQALLAKIRFNPRQDRLWLVGDLINRGSGSLEVLRWCYAHRDVLTIVLGNHDLHALVVAAGIVAPHKGDTLDALLSAPDAGTLLDWLRQQHLMYREDGYLMVHAGLLPQWTATDAMAYATEVEQALRGKDYLNFLRHMYGNQPNTWEDTLTGMDRLRVITNAATRLRICSAAGVMEFKFKGELADIPDGYLPWFDVPNRESRDTRIIFGHWSALGLQQRNHIFALDTGCLWGGQLTAMDIHTQAIVQVPSHPLDNPITLQAI